MDSLIDSWQTSQHEAYREFDIMMEFLSFTVVFLIGVN